MNVQCTAIEFNQLLPFMKVQYIYLLTTIDDASKWVTQTIGPVLLNSDGTSPSFDERYRESAEKYYEEDLDLHWADWMTTLAVARLFGYSSGRKAVALMERAAICSTRLGRWVLYDRLAAEDLKATLDETLSMSEASRRVGLKGPRGLYPYVVSGRIKATEVAGHLRFELGELERFMEQMSPVGAVSRKRKPMEK